MIFIAHLYVKVLQILILPYAGHPLLPSSPQNSLSPIIFYDFIVYCIYTFTLYEVILLIYLFLFLFPSIGIKAS